MTDMFTGIGLINTDFITHWRIYTDSSKCTKGSFVVQAMIGSEIVATHTKIVNTPCSFEDTIERGIVSEAIYYAINESRKTGKPAHLWKATVLAEDAVILMNTKVDNENPNCRDAVLRNILSAKEGTCITVEGFDESFTRVDAFALLREMIPQKPVLVWLHDMYGNITEITYI